MTQTPKPHKLLFLLILIALSISSCKTSRELPKAKTKSLGTAKLLELIEENAFDYDYFSIKRISCQFSTNKTKTNFVVNLKAKKDDKILVSIKKLNIPVGRVLLTPDSVKYVNYIDRNYFVDDYSYLSDFLNIDLDFATIQSIISHNAFSYRNDPKNKDFKTFNTSIEEGMYVLQSEKERKIYKLDTKGKTQKIERRLKRLDDEALILQKMFYNPENFVLTKLLIHDKTNDRIMNAGFGEFEKVDKKDYPGTMDLNFHADGNTVQLKLKLSSFSTDKISSFPIKIPNKYEKIKVN